VAFTNGNRLFSSVLGENLLGTTGGRNNNGVQLKQTLGDIKVDADLKIWYLVPLRGVGAIGFQKGGFPCMAMPLCLSNQHIIIILLVSSELTRIAFGKSVVS
jgi:hypothetical protein